MLARYYKEGPNSVLSELMKLRNHGLLKEALKNIQEHFKDIKSLGPVSIAKFMGITDKEEHDRITRDGFEIFQFIIKGMQKE
jgi:hypothetical protein